MEPSQRDLEEVRRVTKAIERAIAKARVNHPGITLMAMIRVIFDIAMSFAPEDREFVVKGIARSLTDIQSAVAQHYPEEFSRPTRQ